MCGIVGAVALSGGSLPWTPADILNAARTLRHRGPDDQTSWHDPGGRCLLGHARLRVIDLETGDQPIGNRDGSVQVVFNGEIYNFKELRRELEGRGFRFRTASDSEVLVHGWEAWGRSMVDRLDGMFSFGVWDSRAGSLFLARDRVGKKPLFLYRAPGLLAFASEIKGLLTLPGLDDSLDPAALPFYLSYGYVPAPGTFFRHVTQLLPAHSLLVRQENGIEAPLRYWSPDFRPRPIRRAEALERTRSLVSAAVEKRLVSDVPLGAFLSGGVDSTIVVGLMAGLGGPPPKTFSIGFGDDETYDETAWARKAANQFGADHTEFRVEADSVDLVTNLVEAYDQPFGDSSALPTWLVSELTREQVTVALTGDGGDEIFAGYPRFLGMRFAEAMPGLVSRLGDQIGSRLPLHEDFRHPTRRFIRFFESASLPEAERWLRWVGFLPDDPWSLLREDIRELALEGLGEGRRTTLLGSLRLREAEVDGASPLGRALAINFHTYLPDDLLVKADRTSMAHGLELRSPFLDTGLIDFAASLPDHIRNPHYRLKGLLKDAFREMIPPGISRRRKMGFGVPIPLWFRTKWRDHLEETVLSEGARVREWLRPEPIRRLAQEHWSGEADRGHPLWALLTLELWLRHRG